MGLRLRAMRRVLKDTGSIYLHCDPTESHSLKLVLDVLFGKKNFRNEITWQRIKGAGKITQHKKRTFGPATDTILFYAGSNNTTFNINDVLMPYSKHYMETHFKYQDSKGVYGRRSPFNAPGQGARPNQCYEYKGFYPPHPSGWNVTLPTLKKMDDDGDLEFTNGRVYRKQRPRGGIMPNCLWLDINAAAGNERLGYPTQKPIALLERIIKTSSNPKDIVLDPFCGCGTTVHAAENLGRQWIGIDISRFSTELMRERILDNFPQVYDRDIQTLGLPDSIDDAKSLARKDPFEFEKWACGRIGANGMGIRKAPGDRGADGGIDGVIELALIYGRKVEKAYAIVQVKGGQVTADSVKALSETVRRLDAVAGILVCFEDQMRTVENQRSREVWSDDAGIYPFIQGYSVKDLLQDKRLKPPPQYGRKRSGRITALI